MKKLIASIIALVAVNASAYDVTNTVTIITNIYRRIGEKHYVTNTTINLDVSQQAIAEARAQANRAERIATNALDFANAAANSATTAQSHAADAKDYRDEAEYYADQAHGQVQPIIDEGQRQLAAVQSAGNTQVSRVASEGTFQYNRVNSAGNSNVGSVNSAGTTVINNINARQQWFEEHFGQMVTNVNIYHNEDDVARAGVAQNAADIASLESRVGDNIQQLTTRMTTAEGNMSGLGTRMGTAEGNISSLQTRIGAVEDEIEVVKPMIGSATNYVINVNDSDIPEAVFEMGYKNNPQNVVLAYVKIRRGYVNNETTNPNIQYTNGWACSKLDPTHNNFSKYNDRWWYSSTNPSYNYLTISYYGGNDYIIAYWRNIQYDGDPFGFPTTETTDCEAYWSGVSGKTFYCKLISNTINKRTDLKYIQGTYVYDKNGNKVDELIFKSEVSSDTQRLESHIRSADGNFANIFARLRDLESMISHKNYVYTLTRNAVQIGTLTVNTENPTITEETSSYIAYSFPYTATWDQSSTPASPSVLLCTKKIYKNGITKPRAVVRFCTASGTSVDMASENTTDSARSYFTGDIQFTTYETGGTNPRTFILKYSHTTD